METSIREKIKKFIIEYSKYSHWHKAAICMAAVVAVLTLSALVLPAVTAGHDTFCGKVEHVHTEECYEEQLICGYGETGASDHVHTDSCYTEEKVLICTLAETPGHTHTQECISSEERLICTDTSPEHVHTAECYETVETYICGQEESAGHTHTDACYQTKKVLSCTAGETGAAHQHTEECYEKVLICTKEEHIHSVQCYSNPKADVETQAAWEQTMADVKLSGDWSEDLITIAKSQLGYHESKANYMISEQNEVKGYSRYGAWYGDAYGDWSAMFVSFCLRYAQIPSEQFVSEDDCGEWITRLANAGMYQSAGGYTPVAGDIVFIDYDENGAVDHVGIVETVNDKEIGTIEGDSEDSVCRRTYSLTDVKLLGYGVLPEEPKQETEAAETESTASTETPEIETANTKKASAKRYAANTPSVASVDAAGEEAEGEGTVQTRGAEMDLKQWLTTVSVQHSSFYHENWQDVTSSTVLEENDRLKVKLEYTIPGGQLSSDNKVVVYQLPSQIKKVNADSGAVYNDAGQVVGDYTITESGQIRITFNDKYVADNQNGNQIKGSIFFQSYVNNITKENDGSIKLPFKDSLEVNVQVKDNGKTTEDLKVEKSTSDVNQTDGTVKYTIKVTSQNGTGDSVTLQDVMDQMAVKGGTFTVTDKNGKTVTNIQSPEDGADRFELTLPKMEAGDKYTITYTAKLKNELVNGTINANNKVNVSSEDKDGKKLIHSAEVKTEFKKEVLEKKGEVQSDGKVKWTITVNKGGADISGWELSDVLNGQTFTGPVTISPAVTVGNETKTQITLPFTFPSGSNKVYTITYETATDLELGQSNIQNTATLKDPNHPDSNPPQAGANPWVGEYNPLKKTAVSISSDSNPGTITWKVTLNADKGDVEAPWTYTDELQNGQWYTQEQIDYIKNTLEAGLAKYQPTFTATAMDGESGKYKGFKVEFKKDLKKGSTYEFTYTSMAPLGNGEEPLSFSNKASINEKVWTGDSIKYMPTDVKVEKFDATNQNNGLDTQHNFQEDGTISWGIQVYVPDNYTGDLKVIEKLPEGVILQDPLTVKIKEQEGKLNFNGSNEASGSIWDTQQHQPITGKKNTDGTVEIVISEGALNYVKGQSTQIGNDHKLNAIYLVVNVKLDDTVAWSPVENDAKKECKVLNNEVIVKDENGNEQGRDDQTQTIIKEKENHVIQKASSGIDENIIPYSITINAEGEDLLEKAETLTLKDTITVPKWPNIELSLVPESVEVYNRNPDGSKGAKLSADEYPYTYTTSEDVNNLFYNLSIQIPDGKPLIVEYRYKASGEIGKEVGQVLNTATLEGLTEDDGKSETKVDIKITESSATANVDGATLCKVDADNNGILLQGAEFELYRWDATEKDYIRVTQEDNTPLNIVTGTDGLFSMKLAYNTAYKLVETKAPDGYELDSTPYYFYIKNSDKQSYPSCMPENFQGEAKAAGSVIYYPNTKEKMEVKVKKRWLDPNDEDVTGTTAGNIQFELWRHIEIIGGTGVPVNFLGSINYDWYSGQIVNFTHTNYLSGTVFQFSLIDRNGGFFYNKPTITFNGKTLVPTQQPTQEQRGTAQTYTYVITLAEGENILGGKVPANNAQDWEFSGLQVVSQPVQSGTVTVPKDAPVTIPCNTLSNENGWETTILNLPKTGTLEDQNKTPVSYSYYVTEVTKGDYTTSISSSGNDTYVLWTITNKKPDQPAHELPETGGIGTTPYTMAGIVLIAIAFLLYIYKKIIIKK
ncbi:SpaA isopeptide-forming pilin-related protein [Frisingicoccus sp.]|uniref:SpaA isopeptide-forming pilin-related protein n=1 Tax=Frisingicoccus sp. TaxID=1918627 RepID=UPI003AB58877